MSDAEARSAMPELDLVVRRGEDLGADIDDLVAVDAARADDRRARLRDVVTEPGAVGVLALVGDRIVGSCAGARTRPGQPWHDHLRAALSPELRERWLKDAFVVRDLRVAADVPAPDTVADALLSRLLDLPDAAGRRSILAALEPGDPASPRFSAHGFDEVIDGVPFTAGSAPLRILGRSHPDA